MQWLHYVSAILPGLLLIVSEILPFTKGKANGVLHAIYVALSKTEEALPKDGAK